MQRTSTASLDFTKLPVEEKPGFGNGVTSGLTTYAGDFPNLPIPVTDLQKTNGALSEGITDANTGNHVAKAGLITLEKKWDTDFRTTAKYVGSIANGNVQIIIEAGLEPTKGEATPPKQPEAVKNFDVEAEKTSGVLTIGCDSADGVKGYLFIAAQTGATVTQNGNTVIITVGDVKVFIEPDTHRKIMMQNLAARTEYNVTMLPFNSAGCGPLAASQNIMSQ